MAYHGRILLADDEVNFQQATAELLQEQGYLCDVVPDAHAAAEKLRSDTYDVLIADIKMPGNTNLEFIPEFSLVAKGLSVILVTGYPSAETAINSVQLPVLVYLVKPFKFDELLTHVRFGIERGVAYRATQRLQEQMQEWHQELDINAAAIAHATGGAFSDPLGVFLTTSFRRIIMTLKELEAVTVVLAGHGEDRHKALFHDPRLGHLKNALVDAVAVLEKTKHAFKSKDLGALRKRLEGLIQKVEATP